MSVIYIALGVVTALQLITIKPHLFKMPTKHQYKHDIMSDTLVLKQYEGHSYTAYNNYVVFKQSFSHLKNGLNLYTIYPAEQWDIYKYSPTFALLMAPFAALPDWAGLLIWNLLNTILLFWAVRSLPVNPRRQGWILLFLIVELLINLQNAQSNALLAGLMILAFSLMERHKGLQAALCLVIASYIKVYGAVGFCLFLFYPDKLKFLASAVVWSLIFFLLPLLVTPMHTLIWQYQNWAHLMALDQTASYGLSVMGWLHSWFGLNSGKNLVVIAGTILFFIPFLRLKLYQQQYYRLVTLTAMLLWVVIFNHKAESPTYIIAVSGAAIWYFSLPRSSWQTILIIIVFIFTCLTESDLYSNHAKEYFLELYTIKAVPCILLWLTVTVELIFKSDYPQKINNIKFII